MDRRAELLALVVAIVLYVCSCGPQVSAQTATFTGKELFELCATSQRSSAAFLSCALFIRGFLAGVLVATSGSGRVGMEKSSMTFCLPEGLTSGEAAAAFVRTWRSIERTKGRSNITTMMTEDADVVLPVVCYQLSSPSRTLVGKAFKHYRSPSQFDVRFRSTTSELAERATSVQGGCGKSRSVSCGHYSEHASNRAEYYASSK
jgi:hypothetical protein